MALPAAVATAINAVCVKLNQLDPGASVTANSVAMTALLTDWPKGSAGMWGPSGFNKTRAAMWCNTWLPSLGVDATSIQSLRAFFGV